ncbi:MAG: replication protein [Staphylococcus epidermidis]|nr:replication protein [Staphylococcus epidermidis]
MLKLYYKFNFATEPEKTPKWLEERTYGQQLQSDFDPQLEKDKEEFLKQLKLDWEE